MGGGLHRPGAHEHGEIPAPSGLLGPARLDYPFNVLPAVAGRVRRTSNLDAALAVRTDGTHEEGTVERHTHLRLGKVGGERVRYRILIASILILFSQMSLFCASI